MISINRVMAQNWIQNDAMFNSSGVPSVTFSSPRFADLDLDGDMDLILTGSNTEPLFLENIGTHTQPSFSLTGFVTATIPAINAETAIPADLNGDGLTDLVCGGFSGLTFYQNTGTADSITFQLIDGFFPDLGLSHSPVPTLADIDGDTLLDIMAGLAEDGSVVWIPNTGSINSAQFLPEYLQTTGIDAGLYAFPALADVDGDGDYDLALGRDEAGLEFYLNTGSATNPVWSSNPSYFNNIGNNHYFISPTLSDLDGNGLRDLIYGHYAGPLQYYRNTGTGANPQWTQDLSLFGGVLDVGGASNPFLVDYDGDGDLDLFTGQNLGDILYYRNIGNSTAPAWEEHSGPFTGLDHSIYSSVTAGDITGDGRMDLLLGDLGGTLYFYEGSNSGWSQNSGLFSGFSLGYWLIPRFVDMDHDNDLDVVVGNDSGGLFFLENQGTSDNPDYVLITNYFSSVQAPSNCAPALTDIDLDGDYDLLLGGISGNVIFYLNDGLPSAPDWVEMGGLFDEIAVSQNATPAFGDLNGDSRPDLVIGDYGGLLHYYENQFSPLSVQNNIPETVSMVRTFPNPFNRELSVQYTMASAGDARLIFYSLTGRTVWDYTV
ncbi:MAG: VCBS repeat-containing protein, partial [FCB group bacterium]|nr:VCBS repeat-containing protein [FCB group bacterium]